MPKIDVNLIKSIFDNAVKVERFSEPRLFEQTKPLREWEPAAVLHNKLLEILTAAQVETVHRRMTRAVYFIELVKSDKGDGDVTACNGNVTARQVVKP